MSILWLFKRALKLPWMALSNVFNSIWKEYRNKAVNFTEFVDLGRVCNNCSVCGNVLRRHDIQPTDIQHNNIKSTTLGINVTSRNVTGHYAGGLIILLICWGSLCWMSLCWVSLRRFYSFSHKFFELSNLFTDFY